VGVLRLVRIEARTGAGLAGFSRGLWPLAQIDTLRDTRSNCFG